MSKFIGQGYVSTTTGISGWHTEAEEMFFKDVAQKTIEETDGHITVVVVGVEYGRCVSEIASVLFRGDGLETATIFAVDLFPDDHPVAKAHGGLGKVFANNLAHAGFAVGPNKQIEMLRGDSFDVGNNWSFGQIDYLVIDGDHTYEGVKRDIQAWTPHVKSGGFVVFHDYAKAQNAHYLHFEVKRAVDEAVSVLSNGPDSIVWVQKESQVDIPEPTLADEDTKELDAINLAAQDDFTDIKGIGQSTAEDLYAAEIWTFQDLIDANADKLAKDINRQVGYIKKWQQFAQEILEIEGD